MKNADKINYLTSSQAAERLGISAKQFRKLNISPSKTYINEYRVECGLWTEEQICVPGYARAVRNVPIEEKDEVYAEYGIASHEPGQYEVDHHISLELGGSNDIANLWPEAAKPRPGYHEKDKVENYLHKQVCDGKMTLEEAQRQIATNWLEVYERMPKTTRHKKK